MLHKQAIKMYSIHVVAFLILYLQGSFAATTVGPERLQTDVPPDEPKGPTFTTTVEKSFQSTPNTTNSIHQKGSGSYEKIEVNDQFGAKGKSLDKILFNTDQNTTQQTNRSNTPLGHRENIQVDHTEDTNATDLHKATLSSPIVDTNEIGGTNIANRNTITGTEVVQDLQNGQVAVGELNTDDTTFKKLTHHNEVDFHPPNRNTKLKTDFNELDIADVANEYEFFQRTFTGPLDDIDLKDLNDKEVTTHINASKMNMNFVDDSPKQHKQINKDIDRIEGENTIVKKEKTIVTRKTPLSNLLVTDNNLEQTNNGFTREVTNTVTTTNDKAGTISTTRENTQNDINKQRTTHSSLLTIDKKPTENSKTMPIKITIGQDAVDSEHFNKNQKTEKIVDTTTPTGTIKETYNGNMETEYNFVATPQKPEGNKKKCEKKRQNAKVTKEEDASVDDLSTANEGNQSEDDSCDSESDIQSEATNEQQSSEHQTQEATESEQAPGEITVQIDLTQKLTNTSVSENNDKETEAETVQEPTKGGETVVAPKEDGETVKASKEDGETVVTSTEAGEPVETETVVVPEEDEEKVKDSKDSEESLPQSSEQTLVASQSDEHTETVQNTTTTNNTEEDFDLGTMILLMPTPKVHEGSTDSFIKTMVNDKIKELITYAKINKLASKFLLAGPIDVTVDDVDNFLYNFTENQSVAVLNVDLNEATAEVYKLTKADANSDSNKIKE